MTMLRPAKLSSLPNPTGNVTSCPAKIATMKSIGTSVRPSKSRSTAMVPSAALLLMRSRTPTTYARTSSPVRAGIRLLAIRPTMTTGIESRGRDALDRPHEVLPADGPHPEPGEVDRKRGEDPPVVGFLEGLLYLGKVGAADEQPDEDGADEDADPEAAALEQVELRTTQARDSPAIAIMFGRAWPTMQRERARGPGQDTRAGRPCKPPRPLCHFATSLSGIRLMTFPLESEISTSVPSDEMPIGRAVVASASFGTSNVPSRVPSAP